MTDEMILAQVPPLLLQWYDGCARVLPWREDPTPYRVWVSEIMLQQTRVEAVKPYYERFLSALPTVADLAVASEEQLLKLWAGLGYYNRVRNLQKGAREVIERFGGVIPASWEELRSLSGVGDYTAGAIASIAFGAPIPAVDGNVLRVTSRVLAREDDVLDPRVKKEREKEICRAHAQGRETELPVKAGKKPRAVEERTLFLLTCNGALALRRRPEKGLLAGLWELPSVPGRLGVQEAGETLRDWGLSACALQTLPDAKHVFTHREWRMTAWAAEVEEAAPKFIWVSLQDLEQGYALPSAFKAYFPEIRKRLP